jgi:hypothetical protein
VSIQIAQSLEVLKLVLIFCFALMALLLLAAFAWLCPAALGFAVRTAPSVRVVYDPRQSEHVAKYEHDECPARTAAAAELLSSMPGIELLKPSCCDTSKELAEAARAKALRLAHATLNCWL